MTNPSRIRRPLDLEHVSADEVSPQERALYEEFKAYTTAICDVVYAETAAKLHAALDAFTAAVDAQRTAAERTLTEHERRHEAAVSEGVARASAMVLSLRQEADSLERKCNNAIAQSLERLGDTEFLDQFADHRARFDGAVKELTQQATEQSARIEAMEALQRQTSAATHLASRVANGCAILSVLALVAMLIAVLSR